MAITVRESIVSRAVMLLAAAQRQYPTGPLWTRQRPGM